MMGMTYTCHTEHWLPKLLRVQAITIWKTVYVAPGVPYSERLRLHEEEHVRQWAKHGRIGFAVKYAWEYLEGRLSGMGHDEAYRTISFEVDARVAEAGGRPS